MSPSDFCTFSAFSLSKTDPCSEYLFQGPALITITSPCLIPFLLLVTIRYCLTPASLEYGCHEGRYLAFLITTEPSTYNSMYHMENVI